MAFYVPFGKRKNNSRDNLPPEIEANAKKLYEEIRGFVTNVSYDDGFAVLCAPLAKEIEVTNRQHDDKNDTVDLILKITPAGQSASAALSLKLGCMVLCVGHSLVLTLTYADLSDIAKSSIKAERLKAIGESRFTRYDLEPSDYSRTACLLSFNLSESDSKLICDYLGDTVTRKDINPKTATISCYGEAAKTLSLALAILIYCAK